MLETQIPLAVRLVNEYELVRWQYQELAERVRRFLVWKIDEHFKEARWPYLHLSQARAKSPDSLLKNLLKDKPRYCDADGEPIPLRDLRLGQIGDLAAVRMIFYFKDDLIAFSDSVRKGMIEAWFGAKSSDWYDPRDPPRLKKHDAFGYASHHFPVFHTANTAFGRIIAEAPHTLPQQLQCEVQLRTVLQHAWAEGEHDIRYKGGELVSDHDRRQWGLVAALVECADDKLATLKQNQRERTVAVPVEDSGSPPAESYAPVHEAGQGEPRLQKQRELFDVDAAMSTNRFRRAQFERLKEAAPSLRLTHDSLVVRLASWTNDEVCVQPCLYSDEVVTQHQRSVDLSVDGRTLRERARDDDGRWLPFASSPMANSIGVACMVRSLDGCWLISGRSRGLSFDPGTWGCSASGDIEWSELEFHDSLIEAGRYAISREAHEEIGVKIPLDKVTYAGLAREPMRCGKPQMFFVAEVGITRAELGDFYRVNATDEHDAVCFVNDTRANALVMSATWDGRTPSSELREALRRALSIVSRVS